MDEVSSSQFQGMREAFAREGISIDVAYTPAGEPEYMYETGRLLARADVVEQVQDRLPGAGPVDRDVPYSAEESSLVVLSIDDLRDGHLTVPQALDLLDARLDVDNPALTGGFPLVTPVHIMHITRTCPATEPEVPSCCAPGEPCSPCPPPAADGGAGVVIGVCDTGLLADNGSAPWLDRVTGELDPLRPLLPNGLYAIPSYCGHGTFAAGVARCEAPESDVYVANHFAMSGGEREWVIVQKLMELIARDPAPQVVNLSAGTYTRNGWALLSFSAFDHGGITLTAAAGNDATDRKFFPAAFDWAVSVGALGADRHNRAWFSNYGDWVDVYTPGEGLVNAFATGEYTYHEPPKRPARQIFDGRARWSGTSFAAPLVAGLIAAQMSADGVSAADATQAVLAQARAQAIPGTGPVLLPR
jgi:subtilisin family serine protease